MSLRRLLLLDKKKKILADKRFKISHFFIQEKEFENLHIYHYSFCDVALSDLRRRWLGKELTIKELSPYKYLITKDKKIYTKYSSFLYEHHNIKTPKKDFIKCRQERFDADVKSLEEKGYDVKSGVIIIDKRNCIVDGVHRSCWLMAKYGEKTKIKVLKIWQM